MLPLLEKRSHKNKQVMLMGDINVNLLNYNTNKRINQFVDELYRNHRNQENYDNWREAAKLTDESFENDHQQFLENKYLQAEEAPHLNQSSKVYSIIRDISGNRQQILPI